MMQLHRVFCVVFLACNVFDFTLSEGNYFLKAAKNVPRIGRSGNSKSSSIDEMGKFLMKASKSVPRIGRRNEEWRLDQAEQDAIIEKRAPHSLWSDIADKFEYEPELFSNPDFLSRLEQESDDGGASGYDWESFREKRESKNKFHPKFRYLM